MANFKEKMKRKRKRQETKLKLQIKVEGILRTVYRKVIMYNLKNNYNPLIMQFCCHCIAHRAIRKVIAKLKNFAVIENADCYIIVFEWSSKNELNIRLEEPLLWYNQCTEKILGMHQMLPTYKLRELIKEKMKKEGFQYERRNGKDTWLLDLK